MQTLFTFIAAFLVILPIIFKLSSIDISFINPTFLKVYIIISVILFIAFTLYDVITYIQKKAPDSIKYLAFLSTFALIGILPGFTTEFYGFIGFPGFLAFMSYNRAN